MGLTITTEPIVEPSSPTTTFYQGVSADYMKGFEQMLAILPNVQAAEAEPAAQVRSNLSVPDAFCASAINAAEQLPWVRGKFDPEQARNDLQFLEAFRSVESKADEFLRRLRHTLRAVKSRLARSSLVMYRMTQSAASDKRSPDAEVHRLAMSRTLRRRGLTKAQREERQKLKEAEAALAKAKEQQEQELKVAA
jgi:hypothetical protein